MAIRRRKLSRPAKKLGKRGYVVWADKPVPKANRSKGKVVWTDKPTDEADMSKGEIVWIDNSGALPAPFAQNIPKLHEAPKIPEKYELYMVPGALWLAKSNMTNEYGSEGVKYPTLMQMRWDDPSFAVKSRSMLIYAGEVRTDERTPRGLISVVRHTFIASGTRYIVNDFSAIEPVM